MVQEINSHIEWTDLKVMVHQRWKKLSEDELARIDGNEEQLIAALRKHYGYGRAQAEIEIDKWLQEVYAHYANL